MAEIRIIEKEGYKLTNFRAHCRRGVVWLGQTCNQKCYFCYFARRVESARHPEHAFMSLDKARTICKILRERYNNNSIDIQGGEPTIYPAILELLQYCNAIGLKPTLITNALVLNDIDKCAGLKKAGIFDCLVSVQALGDVHDRIVGVAGAHRRQMNALDNLRECEIPIRFNTVLSYDVLPQLLDIAKLAVDKGARVCNFIAFNPTADDDTGQRKKETVPKYTDIVKQLLPAIKYLDENEIEVNVRYLPFCVLPPEFRKFVINHKQNLYDLHEWDVISRFWVEKPEQRQAALELSSEPDFIYHVLRLRLNRRFRAKYLQYYIKNMLSLKSSQKTQPLAPYHQFYGENLRKYKPAFFLKDLGYHHSLSPMDYLCLEYHCLAASMYAHTRGDKCLGCSLVGICDGFHKDYPLFHGFDEAQPVDLNEIIYNPVHYMCEQLKVVEKQEYEWALPLASTI